MQNKIYLVKRIKPNVIGGTLKFKVFYNFENALKYVEENKYFSKDNEILALPINDFKDLQICPQFKINDNNESNNIKYVYIFNYRTTFNNGELWKQKIFSSLEKARKYANKYHETGYKILDYYYEIQQLDYEQKNNNVYKNKKIIK